MARMSVADFEARYRADSDPWDYTTSDYERAKYAATLEACGPGPFGQALELGASIGVFSALLAPRCRELVTLDAAPTAVAAARRRLRAYPHVSVLLGCIPAAIPARGYDIVVASEILYYLSEAELNVTLKRLRDAMKVGARLVAVHWRPPGPERPLDARTVHAALRAASWLRPVDSAHTADYRLDVLERV